MHKIRMVLAAVVFGGALLFSGVAFAKEEALEVPIVNAQGETIGTAKLSPAKNGVRIEIHASQLPPGEHGFHLHEKTFENNDFSTAGAHFNPDGKQHGHLNPQGPHAGDFKNLTVGADGTVHAKILAKGLTLEKGDKRSMRGKSLIIHADPDDYKTDPAGNSGDRIAGANIPADR